MFHIDEDNRNEFKEKLTEKLEKEVIGFLNNKDGGNIFIGISDDKTVIGINKDVNKLQLEIKDRIKNNISPATMGLFDIVIKEIDDKKIVQIVIASGNEKPYHLKKYGMTSEGCFMRIGSSTESMSNDIITDLFSKRTKKTLKTILSPTQNLTFSQLKIFYEEKGYPINENFLHQLGLYTEDNRFNYVAYLLADNNDVSIKVAKYNGSDSYDLTESEEFGYCSLIKATKNVINKMEFENKTFTKITSSERKEIKMVDSIALREAIVNAIVHNNWVNEYPPKFEVFSDHIAISSSGGLPDAYSEKDFLNGFSAPKYPELMRIFKDLDLVEHLGTGIIRILRAYDKDIYEFYPNFIRVKFKYNQNDFLNETIIDTANETINITKIQRQVLLLIKQNSYITQKELEEIIDVSRATITRQIKSLIDLDIIKRQGANKNGYWQIKKDVL